MTKYFTIRFFIMLITFFVVVSLCYIVFEYANNKIWFRGISDIEMFKMAFESYLDFSKGVITSNDWGPYGVNETVWGRAMKEIPTTFKLMTYTLLAFITIGMSLGIIAAYFQGTWIDKVISYVAVTLGSVPEYVSIGIIVIIFGYMLGWVPTFYVPNEDNLVDVFFSMFLPVIALSLVPISKIMRLLRSELIEEMQSEYALLVKCKGFSKWNILIKHALRNSIAPVLSEIPYVFGMVISLSFVIEIAYNIRGAAYLMYNSVIKVGDMRYIQISVPIAVLISAYYILSVLIVTMICNIIMVSVDPTILLSSKKTTSFHSVD